MTARRARLDAELVRRGLARSRAQAADLIAAGQVVVAGQAAAKPATQVGLDAAITVRRAATEPEYVSRGGHKLAGALAAFAGPVVDGPLDDGGPERAPERLSFLRRGERAAGGGAGRRWSAGGRGAGTRADGLRAAVP